MWSDASGLQECTKLNTKPPSPQWTWVSFVLEVFSQRRQSLASRMQDWGLNDPDFLSGFVIIPNLGFPIYTIAVIFHNQKNVLH